MTGETCVRTTLPAVPGPRRTDVPLYVLVDRRSASAAEDVPFVLQNLGRATIVGERTRSAGRNNAILPVGHGFIASVSHSRVQDPVSGREWELVGVQPDIAVDPEGAREAAHRHALGRLGRTAR
jgi:C-terminal processing protease CtpA/Prc